MSYLIERLGGTCDALALVALPVLPFPGFGCMGTGQKGGLSMHCLERGRQGR